MTPASPLPISSDECISRTVEHVRNVLAGDSSGHDWPHVERVWRRAMEIHAREGGDAFVMQLAALLHDIADWKFHGGDDTAGPRAAREWLASLGVADEVVDHVCRIVAGLSFKGANVATPMDSIEGQIVQDADRLDAIGAIGIARAFAYGGSRGREMYDPAVPPTPHDSFGAYKKNAGPTINHFYEKLLLLRERLNTATARRMADERDRFLRQFLSQFFAEWHVSEPPPAWTRLD